MPIHTKYRPQKLDDIVGNPEVIRALKIHLDKESPNRSILLTGPAGCGKTTIAYCIARQLGAIEDDDRNLGNFHELNASDDRGIDTIRDIKDRSRIPPLNRSGARVWLFDEAHMLTKDAKEALLKSLEEPPKKCWFIMATSDPDKFFSGLKDPGAMKRRFTHFEVKFLEDKEMSSLLSKVIRKERKRISSEVISLICRDGMGSPGMALNLLDTVIDLPPEDQPIAIKRWTEKANNVASLAQLINKARRSKNYKWKELASVLSSIRESGADAEGTRRQVLGYFEKVALSGDESAVNILEEFEKNTYDSGWSRIIVAVRWAVNPSE